jgi:ribosomal protein S18 acetylase RimI-like enzyme
LADVTDLQIDQAGTERIPDLAQLWEALEDHHATLPAMPPVRALEESWRRRRAQYERWLGNGSAKLFLATRRGRPVGYLMLRFGEGANTWEIGEGSAEVETLAVLATERSAGVGKALMDSALAAAKAEGVRAVAVGVAHTNDAAIRFYERAGFRPFYVLMLRVDEG